MAFYYKMSKLQHNLLIIFMMFLGPIFGSCTDDETITETSINYTLIMSEDLLRFVTPEVTYVDEDGQLIKITGVENLDGLVIENKVELNTNNAHASGWTQQIITGTSDKCWTFSMKFTHLNFFSRMAVKYIPKELAEDIEDKAFDFHHSINSSAIACIISSSKSLSSVSQSAKVYEDSYVTIPAINYQQGDDLKGYLLELYKNPDKAGYYVDGNGDVTRRDEFEI